MDLDPKEKKPDMAGTMAGAIILLAVAVFLAQLIESILAFLT